jgi:hypothetical protein
MSFYDSASLAFLPSGGAGKDGKAYSIKPVPEYGNELITNGGFDTDSDWTKGTGWTISGGTANSDGSQTGNSNLYQVVYTIGKRYVTKIKVLAIDGTLKVFTGTGTATLVITEVGEYQISNTLADSSAVLYIQTTAGTTTTIDNVSVKEVVVGDGDFDFSRGSNLTATRVNSNGLIEKGRENLLLQSNQFDTTWGSVNTTETSGQAGYDGSSDAWLLSIIASGAYLYQDKAVSGVQTFSFFAKEGTLARVNVVVNASVNVTAQFDLANGIVLGGSQNITSSITSVGDGWYRCSVTYNQGTTSRFRLYPVNLAGGGTSGSIYIQDAQVEQGLVATEYIESGASTGKAGILEHSPRFDYSGGASCPSLLLEPSRTNLVEYSEYTGSDYWNKTGLDHTDNATISPEGVQNASLVTETIDNSQHLINIYYQNRPNVAAGSVTHSVRVKDNGIGTIILYNNGSSGGASAIFDISAGTKGAIGGSATSSDIKPLGNGWYEIYMTFTALAGNSSIAIYMRTQATYSGDGTSGIYIYGAQMEEGSYPTSYIPNHSGGSVTRGEETTSYLTLPETLTDDFTLFFDFKEINTVNGWIAFTDSSNVAVYTFYSYSGHFDVNNGSAYILESSADPNGKIALKQSGSSVKVFVNGVDKTKSGATANLTDIAKFRFASRDSRNSATLNQMLVFPEALSNTDCEILTGTSYESFAAMATALNYTTYE